MKKNIYNLLKEYSKTDIYPFHMPGHKRNEEIQFLPADLDITEIDGFDNLHHATGILKDAQKRAASFYGAHKTWYLVNGSTSGLLISISAVSQNRGGTIVMARNCHKAAYNAAYLNRMKIEYVYPVNGCIRPSDVHDALDKNCNVAAVVITSPTYDGFVSDVKTIAAICHERDVPLIVDEAHGAHFALGNIFPESALNNGADIVIHSLHKTLPSMTQTALIHLNGGLVSERSIDMYSRIYQTSSPSYVMMAGMDACISYIEENSTELCKLYSDKYNFFKNKVRNLKCLRILADKSDIVFADNDADVGNIFDKDCSKILIYCRNVRQKGSAEICDGQWLYDVLLNKYHLQMEMAAADYVIALTSVMDSTDGFSRLSDALTDIDSELEVVDNCESFECLGDFVKPEIVCSVYDALLLKQREILFEESAGCVSCEYIYLYPPGCPYVVPGERISPELIRDIIKFRNRNYNVEGTFDLTLQKILVADDDNIL